MPSSSSVSLSATRPRRRVALRAVEVGTAGLRLRAAGFLGLAALCVVSHRLLQALTQSLGMAKAVAEGDLTSRVAVRGSNEAAQLLGALVHMNDRLRDIVHSVRTNSEGVATASAQIASGSADLSQRTERQASALQEAAASMEQLGSTVKTSSDNARQANQLALNASTSWP